MKPACVCGVIEMRCKERGCCLLRTHLPFYILLLSSYPLASPPSASPTQDLVDAKGRMDEETPLHLAAAEVRIVVVDVKGKEEGRE